MNPQEHAEGSKINNKQTLSQEPSGNGIDMFTTTKI